ncbi:4'-phosphopantetheinyl transferase [Rothia terrae]|uniref:4'-phosphopantetheinyl transferase family protein n=1 Tax=Rothia terrae TaxID=396015 RepID=UPI003823B641
MFPEELQYINNSVPSRRSEYASGRWCARAALMQLGLGFLSIPSGEDRAPIWPNGIVGSITHTNNYRGAAASLSSRISILGVDTETARPLSENQFNIISTRKEQITAKTLNRNNPNIPWSTVIFSAKESVYKAYYQRCKIPLDFLSIEIELKPKNTNITAFITTQTPYQDVICTTLYGKWCFDGTNIYTSVYANHSM